MHAVYGKFLQDWSTGWSMYQNQIPKPLVHDVYSSHVVWCNDIVAFPIKYVYVVYGKCKQSWCTGMVNVSKSNTET